MKLSFAVLASALLLSACSEAPHTPVTNINQLQPASPPPEMVQKPDFASYKIVTEKKQAFADFLKPGVNYINGLIENARTRLTTLSTAKSLSTSDNEFLSNVAELFSLPLPETGADQAWFKEALKRVDVIPMDLVLSQAAIESGWGTSRFAREGNNYFGQWCYTQGCGMVPSARSSGKFHEVATYKDPLQSIRAYFLNVNRNRAYSQLRDIRAELRKEHEPISGTALANGLLSYSSRGQAYVNEVQGMISHNQQYWSQG
ncbi:glucosaminidase domain-containing protein [Enterovibrio sp. ZSDZ35]|uniref:Glucosaminidase domain-containing protein n=1 Tax=Enterovibrio qingdaonensis TaxID=2899818 RepID=A0ABT5QIC9_9GAMM|nr:glucosaminidase domain-containing protein [Enterovibrio sp. ZSDZ35]MDD1780733.1 glucosaminidase domain-containing protein [Enterovibrio sp. ZSDZ35]